MAKELVEINDHSIFTYPEEIMIELRGRNEDGEFALVSYQFDLVDPDDLVVEPREPVDTKHNDAVQGILAENGYDVR